MARTCDYIYTCPSASSACHVGDAKFSRRRQFVALKASKALTSMKLVCFTLLLAKVHVLRLHEVLTWEKGDKYVLRIQSKFHRELSNYVIFYLMISVGESRQMTRTTVHTTQFSFVSLCNRSIGC